MPVRKPCVQENWRVWRFPPFNPNNCVGLKKKGRDGVMYLSVQRPGGRGTNDRVWEPVRLSTRLSGRNSTSFRVSPFRRSTGRSTGRSTTTRKKSTGRKKTTKKRKTGRKVRTKSSGRQTTVRKTTRNGRTRKSKTERKLSPKQMQKVVNDVTKSIYSTLKYMNVY